MGFSCVKYTSGRTGVGEGCSLEVMCKLQNDLIKISPLRVSLLDAFLLPIVSAWNFPVLEDLKKILRRFYVDINGDFLSTPENRMKFKMFTEHEIKISN